MAPGQVKAKLGPPYPGPPEEDWQNSLQLSSRLWEEGIGSQARPTQLWDPVSAQDKLKLGLRSEHGVL